MKLNIPQGFKAMIDGAARHHPRVMGLHHDHIDDEEVVPHILMELVVAQSMEEVGNAACRWDPRRRHVYHWHTRIAPGWKDIEVLG
jgi:hypothetical protein